MNSYTSLVLRPLQANATRGWTVPSLEEVQAESEKLAAAGYTTVGTPNLRASSRNAIQQRQVSLNNQTYCPTSHHLLLHHHLHTGLHVKAAFDTDAS